jgi:hypothetical protein
VPIAARSNGRPICSSASSRRRVTIACSSGGSNAFRCGLKRPENHLGKAGGDTSKSPLTNRKTVRIDLVREDFQVAFSYSPLPLGWKVSRRMAQRAMRSQIEPLFLAISTLGGRLSSWVNRRVQASTHRGEMANPKG